MLPVREKVILVHVELLQNKMLNEDIKEFKHLAAAAGADVVEVIIAKRQAPDAKYFVGEGKAHEIQMQTQALGANLVIFNHALSPGQERNLEQLFQCRVLDRTGLILDIFALRARTFEGKLQVHLAQLQHLSARLKRGWTHLERQRGGIGLRSGPGETQLEVDRRVIKQKIATIKKRLAKVRSQRQMGSRARKRAAISTVAIIGYTNAGKSTLFNRMTKADVYVADKLFATLDPTLRRVVIPDFGTIILADTVGFIRHLPHELVEAFRATLEETKDADLLLHVIDASDELRKEKIAAVNAVLKEIGAENVRQLEIYNKIDLLENVGIEEENADSRSPRIDYDANKKPRRVWISAARGTGIDELLEVLFLILK